jgi:sugar lactone lactonase YvrE
MVAFSSDGTESVIAEGAQGHHLTATSRNEIYFSEPPAHKVWIVDRAGHKRVAHEGINWPRNVRTSTDGSLLVVNDPPTEWVWTFRIQGDGSLTHGRPFYRLETNETSETDAGGMVFDSQGFLYVATKIGVQVCDPQGRVTAIIDTPGSDGVSNVFFAGRGLGWLYIAAWDKVYRRPVKRRGVVFGNSVKPR